MREMNIEPDAELEAKVQQYPSYNNIVKDPNEYQCIHASLRLLMYRL